MDKIALTLLIIGGLNWGLVGIFSFDLVAWAFGGQGAAISRAQNATSTCEAGPATGAERRRLCAVVITIHPGAGTRGAAQWSVR